MVKFSDRIVIIYKGDTTNDKLKKYMKNKMKLL